MHALFRGVSVIPVLTIEREARRACRWPARSCEGGLPVIEVTFRTAAAAAAIAAIARELPQVTVGAGTLLRAADVAAAQKAGARFLVSPGTTPELAAAALATELPYLPGVATPSEIMAARALGICVMKLFPAEALGGVGFLKALAPVFAGIAFLPDRRGRRAQRRRLSRIAQRADGRRLVDGPARRGRRRRLEPHPPPRRARRGDRAGRSGLGFGLVQGHRGANEELQRLLVYRLILAEIDGTPSVPVKAGVERGPKDPSEPPLWRKSSSRRSCRSRLCRSIRRATTREPLSTSTPRRFRDRLP